MANARVTDLQKIMKYFLENNNVKLATTGNQTANNKAYQTKIQTLMSNLEKIIYRLEETIKKAQIALQGKWYRSSYEKQIKENTAILTPIQEIYSKLRQAYPDIISDGIFNKIISTSDKNAIIIFAESGSIALPFEKLLRELNALINPKNR